MPKANKEKESPRTISEVQENKPAKKSFGEVWGINDPMFQTKLKLFLKASDGKPTADQKVAFLRRYIGLPQLETILVRAAEEL